MSESVKLGKVSMTLGGDYSSSQAYDKLTCVQYDGRSWVSRKQVPAGVAPTEANSAYWQKISERGVQGPQGQSYVDKELVPIVNDLTTGGSSNVLSAEQGKVLDDKVAKLSGIPTLLSILNSGNEIVNGSFASNGGVIPSTTRLRFEKPISTPCAIALPKGYLVYEVYYFSSWNSATDYVLHSKVVATKQNYTFEEVAPIVWFSIRKEDNSEVTPQNLYDEIGITGIGITQLNKAIGELDSRVATKVSIVKVAGIAYEPSLMQMEVGDIYYDTYLKTYRQKITSSQYETYNVENGIIYRNGAECAILSNSTLEKVADNNFRKAARIADIEKLKYENKTFSVLKQTFSSSPIRLCSPTIVMSNGFRLKVKDGYAFYYYFYDDNGNVVANSEANNVDVVLNYPFTTKMFIIFKHTDDSNITDINGAIEVCENLYFPISENGQDENESIVAHFSDRTPWEPENVDEGYSNPTSGWGNDTKRADWSATDKYKYYDFLAHYYDQYLGEHEDGYKVTKRGLWQDTANTGHEVFEYDFCPKNYKYTIMLSAGMNADETQGIWGLATFVRAMMGREEANMSLMKDIIRFKVVPILNPSGFDQELLRYNYVNGVNPNYNFNYKDGWARHTASTAVKGEYPDSNYETTMLKKWVNDHAGIALLWVDLHTGRWESSYPNKTILDVRFSSTSDYYAEFNSIDKPLIHAFYEAKGYVTSSDNIGSASSIRENLDYQKHRYALDVCGIVSAMTEMHLESTGYGADGFTNNSPQGIKSYVLQLRQIIMYVVNKGKK